MIGHTELLLILLVVLIIFGGAQVPKLARSLGSSVNSFKKGLKEGEEEPVKPVSVYEKLEKVSAEPVVAKSTVKKSVAKKKATKQTTARKTSTKTAVKKATTKKTASAKGSTKKKA